MDGLKDMSDKVDESCVFSPFVHVDIFIRLLLPISQYPLFMQQMPSLLAFGSLSSLRTESCEGSK